MILNFIGVDLVGSASSLFAVLILSPFVIVFFWAAFAQEIRPNDWILFHPSPDFENVSATINIIMWSYSGYETLGSIVEELKNANKNFLRANLILITMSIATYLVAFLGTVSLDSDYARWKSGYFAQLAYNLGGMGLRTTMVVTAMISSVGTYNALLCTSSQALRALGSPDLLGSRALRWKAPYFQTPWLAILINTIGAGIFSFLSFEALVRVNNVIYCFMLILIYSSLIRLRWSKKDMDRPYKISDSNIVTILIVIPPTLLAFYIIGNSVYEAPVQFAVVCGMFVGASFIYMCLYIHRWRTGQLDSIKELTASVTTPDIQQPD